MTCGLGLAVVASASSCARKVLVEPPPPCPELTEAQLEILLGGETPQELVDWYWNQFDPFCEALYEASRNHRE